MKGSTRSLFATQFSLTLSHTSEFGELFQYHLRLLAQATQLQSKLAGTWRNGLPDAPAGWIYVVARNAGVDRLRREAASGRRLAAQARILDTAVARDEPAEPAEAAYPLVQRYWPGAQRARRRRGRSAR